MDEAGSDPEISFDTKVEIKSHVRFPIRVHISQLIGIIFPKNAS